jgi:5-formaminoimidazole-4-carboxamide-1-(beta)-D-ribofuranosyl 5'-monophosphate synthetase
MTKKISINSHIKQVTRTKKNKSISIKVRGSKKSKKPKKALFQNFFEGLKVEVGQEVKTIKTKVTGKLNQEKINQILQDYDKTNITIGVLGGHSALDVCRGAKKLGFRTLAVCKKGRDKTYSKYYKTRGNKGIIDEVIIVDDFKDIVNKDVQEQLRELNTIFIHNRYFWVYCNFKDIEEKFMVPIFGTRTMLKLEERDVPNNQYYIMKKAGIRIPKIFSSPQKIDRLAIVKVAEAARGYERAFFFCNDYQSYKAKSQDMIKKKIITQAALKIAVIEEYIVGAQVNFNYFYSPLTGELELMGTDARRQTNLDGLLRLPADVQLEVLKYLQPKLIETGHFAVTTKESIIEKIYDLGEKFVETSKQVHQPGIIGPFALQGAIASEEGKEEPVIFDVSMRIPGSPGTRFTPHTGYLYIDSISYGERIAMEIKKAIEDNKLELICT